MMNDEFSALRAYAAASADYYPRATVSLAETTLLTPTSPDTFAMKDEHYGDRKPTKKRKSWGQELPTPKTNLPPRKRAKTEDEKEQRRIERVLRNRQAAQSSRERKRQEVEKLEGEKMGIERQNYLLKQRLMAVEHEKFRLAQQVAKMSAEMAAIRGNSSSRAPSKAPTPSCAPSPTLTADLLQHDRIIKQELEEHPFSLPSPQNTLDPRSSFSSASSSSSSRSPSPSRMDSFDGSATSPDLTQHPAVMLCGLQCQSGAAWRPSSTPITHRDEAQSQHRQQQQMRILFILTTQRLFLTLASAVFSSLLHPLSQLLTSLKTGSALKTTAMTPMLFHLIQWLISTPANPLRMGITSSTSTNMINTLKINSISSQTLQLNSTFRISLLRRLLACSPALARPLKDATGRALQMKTSDALRGNEKKASASEDVIEMVNENIDQGMGASLVESDARPNQGSWQSLMTLAMAIELIEKRVRAGRKRRDEARICTTRSGTTRDRKRKKGKTLDRKRVEHA